MYMKEQNICRLCLTIVDNQFELIDEITREMFDVLSLRVNLGISEDPIICQDCAEVAVKCFNFKSVCMDTEELIFSFALGKNEATFDLKDMYTDRKDVDTLHELFICRFCTLHRLGGSNFIFLDTLMHDVMFAEGLAVLLPKMNFNIIKNAVICTSCRQLLKCYIKFVENCYDIEQKITKYCQNEGVNSMIRVKLSEVCNPGLIKHDLELDGYTQMYATKRDGVLVDVEEAHCKVYNDEFIKTEEALDIKDEVNFNETGCETSSVIMVSEMKNRKTVSANTSINNSSSQLLIENHTVCTCDTIHYCSIKCELRSTMISSEIRLVKAREEINEVKDDNLNTSEVEIYKCDTCNYETNQKESLRNHVISHEDITKIQMYKCTTCAFETKAKSCLKRHTLVHKNLSEVETYKCSMCTYETKYKGRLQRHTIIHKDITEVKMHKCSMCTFRTKHSSSLKKHMIMHKGTSELETYKCSKCSYEGIRKDNFRRHMRNHKDNTEVKIHNCSMCTYQTKRTDHLKTHILTHKDITEVEVYKCSKCTYKTKQKSSLKPHMLIHKDHREVETYKCSMCTYKGKRKTKLMRHMLIHKDVREGETYKCAKCNYKTYEKAHIKRHVLIHQYKCVMCTYKTYQNKWHLKRHILIHQDKT